MRSLIIFSGFLLMFLFAACKDKATSNIDTSYVSEFKFSHFGN